MSKLIRITCEGAAMMPYTELLNFQDELKNLTRDSYESLKNQILEEGFCEPINVWKGKKKIGNGHQRLHVIKQMVEKEGYELKDNLLPVSYIIAKTEKEFARKVLGLAGNYGTINKDGLKEYLNKWDFTIEEFAQNYQLPGIDKTKFIEEFRPPETDDLDLGGDPEVSNPDEEHPTDVPTSQVRMVQLFFDVPTADKFTEMVDDLKEYYGTSNVTDTVLNAVKGAYDEHGSAARTKN